MSIWSAVWALILGALGWGAFAFFGSPVVKFFELRRETKRRLLLHPDPPDMPEIELMKNPPLTTAQVDFNDIAAQLIAFDDSEMLAAWFIGQMGYNPRIAGNTLMALSEWWRHPNTSYDDYRQHIHDALKFRDPKPPKTGDKPNW